MITNDQIQEAAAKLDQLKNAYLLAHGWRNTCNTPGSFWLYIRDFADVDKKRKQWHSAAMKRARKQGRIGPSPPAPYGIITAPLDLAVSMTASELEQYPAESDE